MGVLVLTFGVMPAWGQTELVIDGTGDSQWLLRALGEAFEKQEPGSRVVVPNSVGSSGGVRSLISGNADLARVARPLKDKELRQAPDLVYREFARSSVVFVANLPQLCLVNLTTEQVIDVFSGAISSWHQLDPKCPVQKIFIANREAGDSSRSVLEANIPGLAAFIDEAGKVIYSTPETVETLVTTPYTLGYLPLAMVPPQLHTLRFNGMMADVDSRSSGDYPLFNRFALVWRGPLQGVAARFVNYLSTPEAAAVMRVGRVQPLDAR